ncbi:MAG: radical SAM protein [Planctomycetes bacterium]|nr:radical SAM protein [Planctomycetota bacterium]
MTRLDVHDHDRGSAGFLYTYPVVSRRARGVSVGINLNPNNACNWRCVYCQVPDLAFGSGPEIDLERLERELDELLTLVLSPGWMLANVPEGMQRLNDVALSGNGEPTSSPSFHDTIERIGRVLARRNLLGKVRLVLITNGSLVHKPEVLSGISALAGMNGEVWFKVDSATEDGQRRTNSIALGVERTRANLELAARAAPTWIQTCVFARDGKAPTPKEQRAYLEFVGDLARRGVPLRGVLLYGLARTSCQPEARELARLPAEWLENFANEIRTRGLEVRVDP